MSLALPEQDWPKLLTKSQEDFVENVLDTFELRTLDTRDRDLCRHAIYYALLYPPRAK